MYIKKKVEELLQYGIESFLHNRFDKANMFFSIILSKEPGNRIARFGVMCIDAIEDGLVEAKDMFSVFIFSSEQQQESIMEVFERYQNNAMYVDGNDVDYLYDVLSLYNVRATSLGDDLYLSKIEPDSNRGINTNMLLGKVYEKMGDYSKAIDYLAKAAQMKPFDDNLRKELMKIVRKKKKKL